MNGTRASDVLGQLLTCNCSGESPSPPTTSRGNSEQSNLEQSGRSSPAVAAIPGQVARARPSERVLQRLTRVEPVDGWRGQFSQYPERANSVHCPLIVPDREIVAREARRTHTERVARRIPISRPSAIPTAMNTPSRTAVSSSRKYQQLGLSSPQGGSPSADDSKVNFSSIWTTIRRGKWWILLTSLLVTGAVTGYTLTLPEMYESRAIVSVEASPTNTWALTDNIELSKEVGLLKNSGELNRRVVERMRAVADTASGRSFTIFDPVDEEEPTTFDIIDRLQEQTSFNALPDQSMIVIVATSEVPKEATHIVNVYAEEYRQFSQEVARAGMAAARSFLEEQLERRRQEVERVENEWEAFALENNVATEGEGGQRVAQEYVELGQKRDALKFQLEQEKRMKATLESQLEAMRPELRGSVVNEQRVQSLRTQIDVLQTQLAQLQLQAGEYYTNTPSLRGNEESVPELAELKRRIDQYQDRKDTLTEQLVTLVEDQGLEMNADGAGSNTLGRMEAISARIDERVIETGQLEEQIRGLNQEIAGFQGRLSNIPRQTIEREQIRRRLTQSEEFYKQIAGELRKTEIAEESELGYVSVVRAAVIPNVPVSPDLNKNIILGVLLGLGFGVGVAFIIQSTDTRIQEPKDIQSHGYSLLGVVPPMDREIKSDFEGKETVDVLGKQLSTKLLPLLNPWSAITENYRLMRTNLQYSYADDERDSPQVLLVTSPEPADGKTTTAVNLALTFALSDHKVLLIDADLRRPTAHTLMDVEGEPGLADLLRGKQSLDSVLQPFVDGFSFVAAGKTKVPPAEMLDSKRMRVLLAEARDRADIVIIDTPPVLAASDTLSLAVQSDATLVVARAGTTDRRALDRVRDTLDSMGVPVAAVIFNRFDARGGTYEYGYREEYGDYQDNPDPVLA